MANSVARASQRIIPRVNRIDQRSTPGSLTSVHEAALLELAAGNLKNAWALLQEALGVALLHSWREVSGKPNSQVENREHLLLKLYSRKAIDKWTMTLLRDVMKHPHGYDLRRVDLLAGIVRSFVFDKPAIGVDEASETLIAITEPVAPEPEVRDPRQVEEWLPVPTAAPVEDPEPAAVVPAPVPEQPKPYRERYLPTEAEIERECRKIIASRYPTFPLTEDQYRSPHWREHEARLMAIGIR